MVVMVRCVHCTTWSLCTLRLVKRVARPGESDPCPGPGLEAKVIKKQKWVPFEMTESILKMSECQTKAGNQISHTLSHSLTLSLFHSLIHSLSTCWTTFVFMSMLKSHSLTFTLSHSHTLTLSHSLIQSLSTCWTSFVFISLLKSHCLYAKIAMYFLGHPHPLLLH